MSYLQQSWFAAQIAKDNEEEDKKNIAIAEYLAGFINPKAVKAIRNSRDNSVAVSDTDLEKTLSSLKKDSKGLDVQSIKKPKKSKK